LNILYIYKDYYPVLGGIENNLKHLAEAMRQRGHAVTVLVCNPGRATVETELEGVRVIKVGRLGTFASMPLSPGYFDALRHLRPDITHIHAPYPLGEVAQFWAGRGRPYVITYHADVTRPIQKLIMVAYGPLLHRILNGAGRILATSPYYIQSSPYLRPVAAKTSIVTSSVDTRRFTRPTTMTPHPPTILFVGKMRHYKGVDHLIRAMPHLPSEVQLRLCGDGPKRAEWEALTNTLNLQTRVQFLGEVSDAELPVLYHQADVFVLPAITRAEALGLVMVEAMASGLPCVTTEIGTGTSYLVEEGQSGFVVPPADPPALAAAIGKILADPALRQSFGQRGYARVQSEFTLEAMTSKVEGIYEAVLTAH